MADQKIRVKLSGKRSETAYIQLPGYPARSAKSVSMDDLIDYNGPRVILDFNESGTLIGIEILVSRTQP